MPPIPIPPTGSTTLPSAIAMFPAGVLVAAAHGPVIAWVLATMARDKVQGLALSKITSLAAVAQVSLALPGFAGVVGAVFPAWWLARGLAPGGAPAMLVAVLLIGLWSTLVARSQRM